MHCWGGVALPKTVHKIDIKIIQGNTVSGHA